MNLLNKSMLISLAMCSSQLYAMEDENGNNKPGMQTVFDINRDAKNAENPKIKISRKHITVTTARGEKTLRIVWNIKEMALFLHKFLGGKEECDEFCKRLFKLLKKTLKYKLTELEKKHVCAMMATLVVCKQEGYPDINSDFEKNLKPFIIEKGDSLFKNLCVKKKKKFDVMQKFPSLRDVLEEVGAKGVLKRHAHLFEE